MLTDMVENIKKYSFTHDPDIDYAELLKLHHLTAIKMAHRELEWGKDTAVVSFAKRMSESEDDEVDAFEKYAHSHRPDNTNYDFFNEAQRKLSDEKIGEQKGNIDTVFVEVMLQHHQLAIALSQLYLKYSNDLGLRKVAENVISHHEKNISELKSLP